ncbi:hypothetical protein BCR34DRAFT_48925 [Clohesyomyces aquaticus]|uniref:Uncharacterized protein n=1 Tax=Clohesyomyces aquaticus TaxID=1231657 RepID=A0A1Y1Z4J2_9PLEO|nr:hypothetical protein BCR34DRAFT_48925 [Clohesyomyces aquaticus]
MSCATAPKHLKERGLQCDGQNKVDRVAWLERWDLGVVLLLLPKSPRAKPACLRPPYTKLSKGRINVAQTHLISKSVRYSLPSCTHHLTPPTLKLSPVRPPAPPSQLFGTHSVRHPAPGTRMLPFAAGLRKSVESRQVWTAGARIVIGSQRTVDVGVGSDREGGVMRCMEGLLYLTGWAEVEGVHSFFSFLLTLLR